MDCLDNALCCFDGCANVCQGEGARPSIPRPQSNARGQERQPTQANNNNGNENLNPSPSGASKNRPVDNPNEPQPSPSVQQNSFQSPTKQDNNANTKPNTGKRPGYGQPSQSKDSSTSPKPLSTSGSSTVAGVGGGLLFPLVSKNNAGYSNGQEENTNINQPKSVKPSTNTVQVKSTQQDQPSSSFVPPSQVQTSKPQNQPRRPKPTSSHQVNPS